jgi:hypothetical protein
MPNSLIKKIHEQTGQSTSKLEREYQNLEQEAKKNHAGNEFAYATGTLEKITGYKPNK